MCFEITGCHVVGPSPTAETSKGYLTTLVNISHQYVFHIQWELVPAESLDTWETVFTALREVEVFDINYLVTLFDQDKGIYCSYLILMDN